MVGANDLKMYIGKAVLTVRHALYAYESRAYAKTNTCNYIT